MLKQERAVKAGEIARVEIEDPYLRLIEEELVAETKRKKLQKEIDQECCPLIFHPDLNPEIVDDIIDMLKDAQFEILKDENITLDPTLVNESLNEENIESDFMNQINGLINDTLRCVIVAKGPEGVIDEISNFIGPKEIEEFSEDENFESIRDKFGNGKSDSCVTVPDSKEQAKKVLSMIFPDFSPPKLVIYAKEQEINQQSILSKRSLVKTGENILSDTSASSLPEYNGPPRVIVLVKPPAYDSYRNSVVSDLESNGFKVLSTKDYTYSENEAKEFYAEFESLSSYESLISFMTSGPTFVIMACRENAYNKLKSMLGPESYAQAAKENPDCLRAKYSCPSNGEAKEDDLTWIDGTVTEKSAVDIMSKFFPVEETFALLKPDSRPAWDDIIEDINKNGFKIEDRQEIELTPDDVKVIYSLCIDKVYFDDLLRQMTSGPSLALILKAQDAVKKWSRLIGPTDPDSAVDSYPDNIKPEDVCLRATYGISFLENAVHGSSNPEDAKKCIQLIFGNTETETSRGLSDVEINISEVEASLQSHQEESELNPEKSDEVSFRESKTMESTEVNSEAEGQPAIDTEVKEDKASEENFQRVSELKEKPSTPKLSDSRNSNNSKTTSRGTSKLGLKRAK
nr:thioredoxin domain containing protein 3 [Hymenolepis microstoma]